MRVQAYENLRRQRPDLRLPPWDRRMIPEQVRFAQNMTRAQIIAARTYQLLASDGKSNGLYAFVPPEVENPPCTV